MTFIQDFACTIFGFVLACIVAVTVTVGLNLSAGEAFVVGLLAGMLLFNGGLLIHADLGRAELDLLLKKQKPKPEDIWPIDEVGL